MAQTAGVELTSTAEVLERHGPAPCFFVRLPQADAADVREVAAAATDG